MNRRSRRWQLFAGVTVIALVGNLWWLVSITLWSARKVGPDEVRK